jgi:hypothetical protein
MRELVGFFCTSSLGRRFNAAASSSLFFLFFAKMSEEFPSSSSRPLELKECNCNKTELRKSPDTWGTYMFSEFRRYFFLNNN